MVCGSLVEAEDPGKLKYSFKKTNQGNEYLFIEKITLLKNRENNCMPF